MEFRAWKGEIMKKHEFGTLNEARNVRILLDHERRNAPVVARSSSGDCRRRRGPFACVGGGCARVATIEPKRRGCNAPSFPVGSNFRARRP